MKLFTSQLQWFSFSFSTDSTKMKNQDQDAFYIGGIIACWKERWTDRRREVERLWNAYIRCWRAICSPYLSTALPVTYCRHHESYFSTIGGFTEWVLLKVIQLMSRRVNLNPLVPRIDPIQCSLIYVILILATFWYRESVNRSAEFQMPSQLSADSFLQSFGKSIKGEKKLPFPVRISEKP